MKNILLSLIATCLISSTLVAQSGCSKYYPFSEGVVSQLSLYNAKGKQEGMVEYHVLSVSSNGTSETANMAMKLIDDKGKEISVSEYSATCSDNVVSIDFNSLMRPEMLASLGDVDAEVTGTNMDLPNNLSIGQKLPDSEMNVKINMSGIKMNMNTSITNREVLAKETITTPAGTFECYVLTQTMQMKSMATNQKSTSKTWIAEGVGVVKSEDYKKNGKLRGMSLLTAFNK